MRKLLIIIILILPVFILKAQDNTTILSGHVSFISTQNIYVRYSSTDGIKSGDTLFISSNNNLKPVLKVINLSSSSCICSPLADEKFALNDLVLARIPKIVKTENKEPQVTQKTEVKNSEPVVQPSITPEKSIEGYKQRIRGSISANTYTDISNTRGSNLQRFRYTLSLDAKNISGSKFSFENYISFKHTAGEWADVKSDLFSALKIYSLSAKYEVTKSSSINIGRIVNPSISSIGAIDGALYQKSFNKLTIGAAAGFRPDYSDYGFNASLFQFGTWLALKSGKSANYSESTLAVMQQMNGGKTDRRFFYLQHSGSILKNLQVFGTFEVDLYKLKTDTVNHTETPQSTFNPTGIYISLRYRMSDKFSISGSYDARKNVIYYETYKTFVDRILESEMRQGFRLQADYRITSNLNFGIQSGYRYLKSDPHKSKNIYSYLTYNDIPGVHINATLSGTYLESSYMKGDVYSATLLKDFFKNKLETEIGYRYVDYRMPESALRINQHIAEASISWQLLEKMLFSVSYEGTFEQKDRYDRIYLQLRKRF